MSFFAELKRRNVFRVGIAYLIAAWLVMQFADVILNNVDAPGWVFHAVLLLLGIGLLFAIWATRIMGLLGVHRLPQAAHLEVDGTVLAFTFVVVCCTSLVFGLVPALQLSRGEVTTRYRKARVNGQSVPRHEEFETSW